MKKYLYPIVRISAWVLVLITGLELFSGFFTGTNLVTKLVGTEFAYGLHLKYAPLLFAILLFAHSLGGFFILIARHKSLNHIGVKVAGCVVWVAALVLFCVLFFSQFSTSPAANTNTTPTVSPDLEVTSQLVNENVDTSAMDPAVSGTVTMEQVAQHNSVDDCWMIIDGNVYDLTKYFGQHPGGDATMSHYCGKDGTEAYETKDKPQARDHSPMADDLLLDYYLGELQ
jgi:cytochrome b involved in lipid metabolism